MKGAIPSGAPEAPLPRPNPGTDCQPSGHSQSVNVGITGSHGPVPGAKPLLSKTLPLAQSSGKLPCGRAGQEVAWGQVLLRRTRMERCDLIQWVGPLGLLVIKVPQKREG